MDNLLRTDALLETGPRRVLVVFNPTAGRRRQRRLADVIARLRAKGCVVSECRTAQRGDAEAFAHAASSNEFDVIAAAGGDGTVNEVVNGLVSSGRTDLPAVAVIPLGTANVLALEIGLDFHSAAAIADAIAEGPARRIHLGMVNGRHFVLMAGAGFDAHVVEGVSIALKRATGKLAYVVESLKKALDYDFPALEIRANGTSYQARMAVACKGRYYGGPFIAAPDARLDKPMLEICILPRTGLGGVLRYGLALPLNKLPYLPEVTVVSAEAITILGPRGAPLQADGDIVARLPAELSVAAETIDLIVPA